MIMQGLNSIWFFNRAFMAAANSMGADKVVYYGVININENGRTVGAVDIWRNVITKELFCEEKRLGILEISDHIGMPKIDKDKKWAVAISRKKTGKDRWKLVKVIKEGRFKFIDTNQETIVEVNVKDYKIIDTEWWSFLVEKKVNHTIEITKETGTK